MFAFQHGLYVNGYDAAGQCGLSLNSERVGLVGTSLDHKNGLRCRMVGQIGFPRRGRKDRGGGPVEARAVVRGPAEGPASRPDAREALDIARYVTDMTAQLEAMAIAAKLELIAYFLGMAKAESELYVRSNVAPDDADEVIEEEAPTGDQDDDGEPELDDDVA